MPATTTKAKDDPVASARAAALQEVLDYVNERQVYWMRSTEFGTSPAHRMTYEHVTAELRQIQQVIAKALPNGA